jgi:ABC-type transport system substrate-binding protein
MLESYEPDQKVVLVRNPDYFDPEQQPYARIEFTHVALGPSTVTALASDQIDIARVPLPDTVAVEAAGLEVERQPGDLLSHVYLCTTDGPFTNPDARRAVRIGLDAAALVSAATQGLGESVTQLMPPGSKYYSELGLEENQFDLEEAQALAKSSGLEGQTIDLMYYAISPEQATLGEVVKSQMEAIGLTVNLVPSQNIYADRAAQKPDMSLWGSFPSTYASVLAAGEVANPCNNASAEIDGALADLWRSDPATSKAAAEALQAAMNELNPILPYARTVYATGYNDSVGGTVFQPYSHAIGQLEYTMLRPNE